MYLYTYMTIQNRICTVISKIIPYLYTLWEFVKIANLNMAQSKCRDFSGQLAPPSLGWRLHPQVLLFFRGGSFRVLLSASQNRGVANLGKALRMVDCSAYNLKVYVFVTDRFQRVVGSTMAEYFHFTSYCQPENTKHVGSVFGYRGRQWGILAT